MRNGLVEFIEPVIVTGVVSARVPFTYRYIIEGVYTAAKWYQLS